MEDSLFSETNLKTDADYEEAIRQMLEETKRVGQKIRSEHQEIDRMQQEFNALSNRMEQARKETQLMLAELKAIFGT